MPESQRIDFFLSYATPDAEWAEWIGWQLESQGYSTVLQAWDFLPGRDFLHEMERALATADRTLALLSTNYATSDYSEAEWRSVFASDPTGRLGKLIPVRVESCEVPRLLIGRVYVDLVGVTAEAARERLSSAVSGERRKPTTEPTFPETRAKTNSPSFPGPGGLKLVEEVEPSAAKHAIVKTPRAEYAFDPAEYSSFQRLTDDLFTSELHRTVPPFSYGRDWVIAEIDPVGHGTEVIAPIDWVDEQHGRLAPLRDDPWAQGSLASVRIQAGHMYEVLIWWDGSVCGLFFERPDTRKAINSDPKSHWVLEDWELEPLAAGSRPEGYESMVLYGDHSEALVGVFLLDANAEQRLIDRFGDTPPNQYRRWPFLP